MTDPHPVSGALRQAAQAIAAARTRRTPLPALPQEIAPMSLEDGYRIQAEVHRLLAPELGPLVGYKIGCTSEVMQKYLAIPHPCAGGVHARAVHRSGVVLKAADYVRVGVECEIAVRLGEDLAPARAPFTRESVAASIECYLPAIEIVDDRYVRWETLGAPTLVADDFFAAGIVLGQAVARSAVPDLLAVEGRTLIDGRETGRGTGADVLGHPHNALAWLANHLASQGTALREGEIVMTGSLVKTVWLEAGSEARMEFSGLGNVQVAFV
ncbi:fumarylacetoacetate hydrolase family protein [Ramlibacter monticola]|uniref:Fumarylacetoacetate hydrolase family protein n=1 Tax=Ramlibacter monticola TaxID=1926872 RepID=A0A936Z2A1_9BURK|nr:fumarylacetoacetate hydrolase family protein [Ramlibacter monticola]MBL0392410.1 fumarylacetoacetate hydrolase family protein [Ramlibacter monticola]